SVAAALSISGPGLVPQYRLGVVAFAARSSTVARDTPDPSDGDPRNPVTEPVDEAIGPTYVNSTLPSSLSFVSAYVELEAFQVWDVAMANPRARPPRPIAVHDPFRRAGCAPPVPEPG